jgi:hypothetical protein
MPKRQRLEVLDAWGRLTVGQRRALVKLVRVFLRMNGAK